MGVAAPTARECCFRPMLHWAMHARANQTSAWKCERGALTCVVQGSLNCGRWYVASAFHRVQLGASTKIRRSTWCRGPFVSSTVLPPAMLRATAARRILQVWHMLQTYALVRVRRARDEALVRVRTLRTQQRVKNRCQLPRHVMTRTGHMVGEQQDGRISFG